MNKGSVVSVFLGITILLSVTVLGQYGQINDLKLELQNSKDSTISECKKVDELRVELQAAKDTLVDVQNTLTKVNEEFSDYVYYTEMEGQD